MMMMRLSDDLVEYKRPQASIRDDPLDETSLLQDFGLAVKER
jgi:hypothetical protein